MLHKNLLIAFKIKTLHFNMTHIIELQYYVLYIWNQANIIYKQK